MVWPATQACTTWRRSSAWVARSRVRISGSSWPASAAFWMASIVMTPSTVTTSVSPTKQHGFEPLMRPALGVVCQSLIVVSYWMPGSAHSQAAWAISRMSSRAPSVCTTSPVSTAFRWKSAWSTTACMNSSVTRTELLAFWYWIDAESRPSRSMSKPASASTRALSSSRCLHQMNSSMSGWSTSRITILAARRVVPPLLIVPAEASAPRMKLTGPDAVPPPLSRSRDERMLDRLTPDPDPPLKIVPSSTYQLRIDPIVSSTDRMKHAEHCGTWWTPTLNQTGELKAAIWLTSRCLSSALKVSAESPSAK